jgi:hypothetical protein
MPKSKPKWTDVKNKLEGFDHAGLLGLVHDLYATNKDNQSFLHTRLGLGEDVLGPYLQTIERWISPDVYRNQRASVAKAKQAIVDFKNASGDPAGLAELMVFYCELAADFARNYGEDLSYLNPLIRMFQQALETVATLPSDDRKPFLIRLSRVSEVCDRVGYGVGDEMADLLVEWDDEIDEPSEDDEVGPSDVKGETS